MGWKNLIISLSLLGSVSAFAEIPHAEYVHTAAEFHTHVEAHNQRVQDITLYLYRKYKDQLGELNLRALKAIAYRHDAAKMRNSKKFRKTYGFKKEDPSLNEALFKKIYGKNIETLDGAEKIEAEALIKRVNDIDHDLTYRELKKWNLLTQEGSLTSEGERILELIDIADKVDRAKSPVSYEEFGKMMKPYSEHIKDLLKKHQAPDYVRDPLALEMAKDAEENYHQIIPETHEYSNVRILRRNCQRRLMETLIFAGSPAS